MTTSHIDEQCFCPTCGIRNQVTYKFCIRCGAALSSRSVQPIQPIDAVLGGAKSNRARSYITQRNLLIMLIVGISVISIFLFVRSSHSLPSGANLALHSYLAGNVCNRINICESEQITQSVELPIDEADQRNGLQSRWCIEYRQMQRFNMPDTDWAEVSAVVVATNVHNQWRVEESPFKCDLLVRTMR